MIVARNITNSVPTAVWLATLIQTYQNFVFIENNQYWISQKEIQETARLLCPKNIDNARISQWCNGDHPNNTYNYLRAKGPLRRLSKSGEFSGQKEQPKELPVSVIIFEENEIRLMELLEWYKNIYCHMDFIDKEVLGEKIGKVPTEQVFTESELGDQISGTDNNAKATESEDEIFKKIYGANDLKERTINVVNASWEIFSKKVGNGLIPINKEASMQLQYAYILKHMLPLVIFQDDEEIEIELETTVNDGISNREVDIMVIAYKDDSAFKIALELKCYKTKASSGGNRGATDIFMKDVYQDLHLLERYCENGQADMGIALVMNDYKYFMYPKRKEAKCWDYDISHGTEVENIRLTTPIGGRQVDILLKNRYEFKWKEIGEFGFLLLKPKSLENSVYVK